MNGLMVLRRALSAVEDAVFPPCCGGCARRGAWLCPVCLASLRPLPEPCCRRCGRPLEVEAPACEVCRAWPGALHSVRGAFAFEGALRASIHRFKYQGEHARANSLAALLVEPARARGKAWDLISPVPLHPRRRRQRGFDQAELLSRRLGRELGLPVAGGLARLRETRPQVGLGVDERRANVDGAFGWRGAPLAGAAVLLIDDVVTTGATMAAAAAALQAAGATHIDGLALARAV